MSIATSLTASAATPEAIRASFTRLPAAPRLFMLRGEEQELRDHLAEDAGLNAIWLQVKGAADRILDEPPVERVLEGRRLLEQSRRCLQRMTHLGMAYSMTGDVKYAERAKTEMLAAAAFSDWNPSHFLDTAEMTAALAIGVDWFHDALDEPTRKTVREAIVRLGLEPSMKVTGGWVRAKNNWNQVCHAGAVLGALVVAEEHPELAAALIARAIEGVPHAMKEYAPDGAYPEGPMYWDYGTSFNVLLIDALQRALGTDFDLLKQPGFDKTAEYVLHVIGNNGLWFQYADTGQRGANRASPTMFYLARWRGDGSLLHHDRQVLDRMARQADGGGRGRTDRLLPMLLIWAKPGMAGQRPDATHYLGRGMTPVALFRTGWDRTDTFVGIKGGQASGPHGHMDAGQFLIDINGVRFADDLGMQGYHSLESIGVKLWDGSEGGQRWQVFRLGPAAHSVLIVDGKNHQLHGRAEFIEATPMSAKLDMSPVFKDQLASATRELRLNDDGSVALTDAVEATDAGGSVRWAMMTRAAVELNERGATLERDGTTVQMRVVTDGAFEMKQYVSDPPPMEYDAPNPGTRMVGFEVKLAPGEARSWRVEFDQVR